MERSILTSMLVAAGIICGLIIAVIIIKVCNKNGKFKSDYDERQQIMIGKSYKYAMMTAKCSRVLLNLSPLWLQWMLLS